MTTRCANWCNRFLCRVPMCTGCGESMGCPEEPSPSSFNFKFYSTPLPWAMALAFCQARGGSLATIDSAAKQAEAVRLANGAGTWIGANDRSHEGQYSWAAGGTLPPTRRASTGYSNWSPGEPSGAHFGNEDCVCFNCAGARFGRPAPTTWNDASCRDSKSFLCQGEVSRPPPPSPSPPPRHHHSRTSPPPPSPRPPLPAPPPYVVHDLPCGGTLTGSTIGKPSVIGSSAGEALFRVCTSVAGEYTFSSCGSTFDTYLRIYDAHMRHQLVGCDDCGNCGLQTMLSHRLEADKCYVIVLEGFSSNEGSYVMHATCPHAPPGAAVPRPPPAPPVGGYTVFAGAPLSWDRAQAYCELRGGSLARIESETQQRVLEAALRRAHQSPPPPPRAHAPPASRDVCGAPFEDCTDSQCCHPSISFGCFARIGHVYSQCRPLPTAPAVCADTADWQCPRAPSTGGGDLAILPPPPPAPSPPPPPPVPVDEDRSCIVPFAQVGDVAQPTSGGSAGLQPCGYPPLVRIVFNDPRLEFQRYSFYRDGRYDIVPTMVGPAACQDECRATAGCASFFYQYELGWRSTRTDYVHKCMLYAAFTSAACVDQTFTPDTTQPTSATAQRYSAAGPPVCSQRFLPRIGGHMAAWVGGRRGPSTSLARRGQWAWSSGATFAPTLAADQAFTQWGRSEPVGSLAPGALDPTDHCLLIGEDGLWEDRPCQLGRAFVCQSLVGGPPAILGLPPPNPPPPPPPPRRPPLPAPPPPPLGPFRGYTFVGEERSWSQAQAYCVGHGGVLAKIADAAQMETAAAVLAGREAWLGATDATNEGVWSWLYDHSLLPPSEGSAPSAYSNWGPNEPSGMEYGDEDCLCVNCDLYSQQHGVASWNDEGCSRQKAFLCQGLDYTPPMPPAPPSPPSMPPAIPLSCGSTMSGTVAGPAVAGPAVAGPTVADPPAESLHAFCAPFSGRFTFSTCGSSFVTKLAIYSGGRTRQVASCDACGNCESRAILSHYLRAGACYTITLARSASFAPLPDEDNVYVLTTQCPDFPPSPPGPPLPPRPPPRPPSPPSPPGPPPPPPSPSWPPVFGLTFFNTPMPWADALASCELFGGTLAKIGSAATNAHALALSNGVPTWIGANDRVTEGVWRWTYDKSALPPTAGAAGAYANWGVGEPSGYRSGDEDCACYNCDGGRQETWNDAQCLERYAYICQGIGPPLPPPAPPSPPPGPPSPLPPPPPPRKLPFPPPPPPAPYGSSPALPVNIDPSGQAAAGGSGSGGGAGVTFLVIFLLGGFAGGGFVVKRRRAGQPVLPPTARARMERAMDRFGGYFGGGSLLRNQVGGGRASSSSNTITLAGAGDYIAPLPTVLPMQNEHAAADDSEGGGTTPMMTARSPDGGLFGGATPVNAVPMRSVTAEADTPMQTPPPSQVVEGADPLGTSTTPLSAEPVPSVSSVQPAKYNERLSRAKSANRNANSTNRSLVGGASSEAPVAMELADVGAPATSNAESHV